ncbi:MAG: LPP20 family lipoprotein [Gammaproteobacteria bacterium]|nr:LPP20 family lipoprotein [Gammaproteobacteria bacterium]
MKIYVLMIAMISLLTSACVSNHPFSIVPPPSANKDNTHIINNKVIETIGYGAIDVYRNKPLGQRKLLAIRSARLDAYRNLAEQVHGFRIKGSTTVKDMVVQSDQYSIMFDTILRGAHIDSITEKDGFIEAHATLTLTPRYTFCLSNLDEVCLNSSNQYQSEVIVVQPQQAQTQPSGNYGLGIFPVPASRFHID